MKKLRLKYIWMLTVLLGTLMALKSCTEPYDVDLESSYTRLVVDGYLTSDTTAHQFILRKSDDYFANRESEKISGAKVLINNGTEDVLLEEDPLKKGVYKTPADYAGEPGRTYTMKISGVDINEDGEEEEFQANNSMVEMSGIDSITVQYLAFGDFFSGFAVNLHMPNPPGNDYLMFRTYVNHKLVSDTIEEVFLGDDELFSTDYIDSLRVSVLADSKPDEALRIGDTVTLEAFIMTEENYEFFIQLQTATNYQNPIFSGPPANVKTNFEPNDKVAGFLNVFNAKRASLVITDKHMIIPPE